MTDILSQEEIDALLTALDTGEISTDEISGAGDDSARARLYDFKRPDKFSKDQLRTIHMLHETFGRLWASSLSGMLRNLVTFSVVSVDQLTYQEFLLSIPDPSVICIFSMAPLEGRSIIEFSPAIAFPIIDRVLGGHGGATQEIRELTDIEKRIIMTLVEEGLAFLKEAWMSMVEIYPEMDSVESNPLFVQIVPPGDMVLLLTFETMIGDLSGVVNICYPYVVLEPILSNLSQQFLFAGSGRGPTEESKESIRDALRGVRLDLEVLLGEAELSMEEIIDLKKGDLIKLTTRIKDDLRVKVSDLVKFTCTPGVHEGKLAAMITRVVVDPEEMLKDERV